MGEAALVQFVAEPRDLVLCLSCKTFKGRQVPGKTGFALFEYPDHLVFARQLISQVDHFDLATAILFRLSGGINALLLLAPGLVNLAQVLLEIKEPILEALHSLSQFLSLINRVPGRMFAPLVFEDESRCCGLLLTKLLLQSAQVACHRLSLMYTHAHVPTCIHNTYMYT